MNRRNFSVFPLSLGLSLWLGVLAPHAGIAAPLDLYRRVDLNGDFAGSTFLQAMMDRSRGVKKAFDEDNRHRFEIASRRAILAARSHFDPKVVRKIVGFFNEGERGLTRLLDVIAGESTTPDGVAGLIASKMRELELVASDKIGLGSLVVAPFVSMASGAGTTVTLNDDNYYYNFGYKPGSDDPEVLRRHVKSGRSFGVGPEHEALDASDVFYLAALEEHLSGDRDPSRFYRAFLQILTGCEVSGLGRLSGAGQTVMSDLVAVYTAELDRNLMSGLRQHPWQNDLAEVTILSSYGVASGLVRRDGELVEGQPRDYFALGNDGSGIGVTRRDRRALQRAVSRALRSIAPQIAAELNDLIGQPSDGDLIHGLMIFLNAPANQRAVRRNAQQITDALTQFAISLRQNSARITQAIQ